MLTRRLNVSVDLYVEGDLYVGDDGIFTGDITAANISGTNTGNVTLATVGASPTAAGATLSGATGQVLTLQPADGTNAGVVSTTTQTFAGAKTFTGAISASNLSGTNTGNVTLATVGSSPAAAGASLSGQVLTLQPADGSNAGVVSTTTQTFAGTKTFSAAVVTGNLTVDTNTLVVDSTNNRVGVVTTSPSVPLEVTGEVKLTNGHLLINTTLPASVLTNDYCGIWYPNAVGFNSETTAAYAAVRMFANMKRTAGGWVQNDTSRPTWSMALGHGVNTDYYAVARSPAGGNLNAGGFVEFFKIDNTGVMTVAGTVTTAASTVTIKGAQANGASAVGVVSDTSTAYSTTGALIHSFRNNGTQKARIDKDGNIVFQSSNIGLAWEGFNSNNPIIYYNGANQIDFGVGDRIRANGFGNTNAGAPVTLASRRTNASNAVGTQINTDNTFSTAGAKLVSVTNNSTEKLYIDKDGTIGQGYTDSTASPGNATINKPAGKSAVASGATSVVITNSVVAATDIVHITPMDIDTAIAKWKYATAAGSFTVTVDAAAAADWKFSWQVVKTF